MFRVDDPRSEPHVLHELTLKKKMAEDAESDIAIRFVDENDYREISAKAVSAKRKLKKNRPSWLVTTLIPAKLSVRAKKMKKSVQARRKL